MKIGTAAHATRENFGMTSTYVKRLGPHHFAHLRAVAEGVPVAAAAQRFLGIEHGNAAVATHRAVVERLRALARRTGDAHWRLLGLFIEPPAQDDEARPSLEGWAIENGLEGWSEAELVDMYEEAFPADRRAARNRRLRERQLELLRSLERVATEMARPQDPVAAWLEPGTAERLRHSGLMRLEDLQQRIARGGRWWSGIRGVGPKKAARVEVLLRQLLPPPSAGMGSPSKPPASPHADRTGRPPFETLDTAIQEDREWIETWIAARAGSTATAAAYRREALRLLLWAQVERQKPLPRLEAEDCLAYLAFLARIPEGWISRSRARPLQPGWAPFAGQLSPASRRQAAAVLGAFFAWLVDMGRVPRSPWAAAHQGSSTEAAPRALESGAFEAGAWEVILGWISARPAGASRARALFVLRFTEAIGLSASELIAARLEDLQRVGDGWTMRVRGKGARNRWAAVPDRAALALEDYLRARGLPALECAPRSAPLVASLVDGMHPIGYKALYQTMRSWLRRAVAGAALAEAERRALTRASVRWLRRTCAVRALEQGMLLKVVQRQLGHADIRTTKRHADSGPQRRPGCMEGAPGRPGLPDTLTRAA